MKLRIWTLVAKLWKRSKDLQIWKWTKHPIQKYQENLHFKRNVYWYLVFAHNVGGPADDANKGLSEARPRGSFDP